VVHGQALARKALAAMVADALAKALPPPRALAQLCGPATLAPNMLLALKSIE
jgi:hypothetical protein